MKWLKVKLVIIRSRSVWRLKFFCNQEVCVLLNSVDHAKDHFTQTEKQRWHSTFCSYKESLVESGLSKLSSCRQELVGKLFKKVVQNKENKLHSLLPALNTCRSNLRNGRKFRPVFKTNRFGLLRPTPSKLKLCSWSIVLEVSFAFYRWLFIF